MNQLKPFIGLKIKILMNQSKPKVINKRLMTKYKLSFIFESIILNSSCKKIRLFYKNVYEHQYLVFRNCNGKLISTTNGSQTMIAAKFPFIPITDIATNIFIK